MNPKENDNEIIELTDEELDEIFADDDFDNGEEDAEIRSFYFSNPDPYAKVKPRPDEAPKREFSFDEKGQHRSEKSVRFLAARRQNRGGTRRHGIHRNRQLRGCGNPRQEAQTHYGAERCR